MKQKEIDGIPQICRLDASEKMIAWFDDRAEELYSDVVESARCLMKHSSGSKVFAARMSGTSCFDQLVYDCCCDEAWEEAKVKWLNGELS